MDKLDHLGWVASASFEIGDARFAIRSTSEPFGEWLDMRGVAWIASPDGGWTRVERT